MGSFSGQFSRPLPGPPWGEENGVGLTWVHAVSSLMRSARGFSLAWSSRVRDRGLLPRARDADSFCLSLTRSALWFIVVSSGPVKGWVLLPLSPFLDSIVLALTALARVRLSFHF